MAELLFTGPAPSHVPGLLSFLMDGLPPKLVVLRSRCDGLELHQDQSSDRKGCSCLVSMAVIAIEARAMYFICNVRSTHASPFSW